MAPRLLIFSDWLYCRLLQIYPRQFREHFAAEMAQVFRSLCSTIYAELGKSGLARLWLPTLWDWGWSAITQWWLTFFQRRMGNMQTNTIGMRDGVTPLSTREAGLAALPFLLYGIASLVSKMDFASVNFAAIPLWKALFINPFLVFDWLTLIGLGIGVALGFPRWAIPYLGWGFLFGWWWGNTAFYGHYIGGLIWLPFAGVLLVGLFIRRSLQPLRNLVNVLWREWTVLSLAIYILYGWLYMMFDENHHPLLLGFVGVTTLAVSLGAWGYFRAGSPLRRILWLLGGLLIAIVLSGVSYATWDFAAYYDLPESTNNGNLVGFIFFMMLTVIMLGNAWLARWRQRRQTALKRS
jgi:hypothetical protein